MKLNARFSEAGYNRHISMFSVHGLMGTPYWGTRILPNRSSLFFSNGEVAVRLRLRLAEAPFPNHNDPGTLIEMTGLGSTFLRLYVLHF
jgi:hypothetical protein